jgi:hypothetical protein
MGRETPEALADWKKIRGLLLDQPRGGQAIGLRALATDASWAAWVLDCPPRT